MTVFYHISLEDNRYIGYNMFGNLIKIISKTGRSIKYDLFT